MKLNPENLALDTDFGLRLVTCPSAIAHACHPVITSHLLRYGSVITWQEQIIWRGQTHPAARLVPPAAWQA